MKTIKRSFSTALIACLLLSLLVPTALAATTIAQKVIEYSFKDYLPVVFETDSNIALGQKSDNGSVPNDNYNTAMETYADNNINSACMYWSSEYVSGSGNPAVPTAIDKGISLAAYVGDWLAIKIKSPGAGEFKVGVRPFSDSSAPKGCNVYVLPIEKENPITAEQLSAVLENTTFLLPGFTPKLIVCPLFVAVIFPPPEKLCGILTSRSFDFGTYVFLLDNTSVLSISFHSPFSS